MYEENDHVNNVKVWEEVFEAACETHGKRDKKVAYVIEVTR